MIGIHDQIVPLPKGAIPDLYPRVRIGDRWAFGKLCDIDKPNALDFPSFTISDFYHTPDLEGEWNGFHSTTFLPEVFYQNGSWTQLSFNSHFRALPLTYLKEKALPSQVNEEFYPTNYPLTCMHFIKAIQNKTIDKAILPTRFDLIYDSPLDAHSILNRLPQRNGTPFLYAISPKKALIGITPEMLFSRQGKIISSEALAGTAPLGKTDTLFSKKNQIEFEYVSNEINSMFSDLCQNHQQSPIDIKKTSDVEHLQSTFCGTLKNGIFDFDIIKKLHPTPAMGGFPKESAVKWLLNNDPIRRGFYSSYFGFLSKESADILVAIRCALIDDHRLRIFVGSGIVADSDPEDEFRELNNKIRMWRNLK
ncbi:MAG: chorismate-binding protein [Simkaniaceae bacterium]|nr:chorismate-binding protein [Simkaniaceae bacterium]MCF7852860.1 chorismate-binding protein [Simkaniaceae bacterium]